GWEGGWRKKSRMLLISSSRSMESAGSPVYLENLVNFMGRISSVAAEANAQLTSFDCAARRAKDARRKMSGCFAQDDKLTRACSSLSYIPYAGCGGGFRGARVVWVCRHKSHALRCVRCGGGPKGLRE